MDRKIKAKIEYEISKLTKDLDKLKPLINKCRTTQPDFIELAALGTVLHSFYTGIESIFIMIEKHYKNQFRNEPNWHKNLLWQASIQQRNRKEIISVSTREVLYEYLQFRHLFRHSYGFELDWQKIRHLVLSLEKNLKTIGKDLDAFIKKGETHE